MNKADLHAALSLHIPNALQQEFPALDVPESPADVTAAIIASANCQIQYLNWLNTFEGCTVGDLALYAGNKNAILESMLHAMLRHKELPGNIGEPIDLVEIAGGDESNASFVSAFVSYIAESPSPVIPDLKTLFPEAATLLDSLAGLENRCIEYMKSSPILQQAGKLIYSVLISWLLRYLFGVALPVPVIDEEKSVNSEEIVAALNGIESEFENANDIDGVLDIGGSSLYLKSKVIRD